MRARRLLAIIIATASVAASCSFFQTGPSKYRFVVLVDSIVAPDTIGPGDTLIVGLRGVIAYDGCAQFDGLLKNRAGGSVTYTVYALHDDRRICVQSLILLNRVDTVLPPQTDPTVITVVEPDLSAPLTRTIVVR